MRREERMESDDFVRIATCATPTEAHLLKGMLEAGGLDPVVADANFVQADSWMTQAVGGVRVLVPASQRAHAVGAIDAFNDGHFELKDDDDAAPVQPIAPLVHPVFSPDQAALWSFALTPVFGAGLMLADAWSAGPGSARVRATLWLSLVAALTALAVFVAHRGNPGLFVAFRASLAIGLVTVTWYFIVAQPRSKQLLDDHGRAYPRRSLTGPALAMAAAEFALGWALSEFG
jgi:hypothetical protein